MDRSALVGHLVKGVVEAINKLDNAHPVRWDLEKLLQTAPALGQPVLCNCRLPNGTHMQLTPAECAAAAGSCVN